MSGKLAYFAATRHPWSCLLFLMPLLIAYEIGIFQLGGTRPDQLRNGADAWLRGGVGSFGLNPLYWTPALVLIVFVVGSVTCRKPRPDEPLTIWIGMGVESIVFAFGLWGVSRGLGPVLDRVGVKLALLNHTDALRQVVTFVGAGIYEEVLFRLLLFSGLIWLMRCAGVVYFMAVPFAALASAVVFAAAHHIGASGEPFDNYAFIFRTVAGVYFALLYQLRGFGVAVGAHAFYDVLVGVCVS